MPSAVRQADPQLRTKIEQAERRVAKLTEAHDDARRRFLEAQKAYEGGRAGAEKLEAAEAALLKALKDLTAAHRELADLVRSAAERGKS